MDAKDMLERIAQELYNKTSAELTAEELTTIRQRLDVLWPVPAAELRGTDG